MAFSFLQYCSGRSLTRVLRLMPLSRIVPKPGTKRQQVRKQELSRVSSAEIVAMICRYARSF